MLYWIHTQVILLGLPITFTWVILLISKYNFSYSTHLCNNTISRFIAASLTAWMWTIVLFYAVRAAKCWPDDANVDNVFFSSVLVTNQQPWLARCASRTARPKTRAVHHAQIVLIFDCVLQLLLFNWIFFFIVMWRYGTGCFMLRNTGNKVCDEQNTT